MSPISKAVEPLRNETIRKALDLAENRVQVYEKTLSEYGWDLDKVAPFPKGVNDRKKYTEAKAKREFIQKLTVEINPSYLRDEPRIVKLDHDRVRRYLESVRLEADSQFTTYIGKLEAKIGVCVEADLTSTHLWNYSILTVKKADGNTEFWKTQQIINVSVLGKLFNQWPTRKMK